VYVPRAEYYYVGPANANIGSIWTSSVDMRGIMTQKRRTDTTMSVMTNPSGPPAVYQSAYISRIYIDDLDLRRLAFERLWSALC
jgi:hypothetical protein